MNRFSLATAPPTQGLFSSRELQVHVAGGRQVTVQIQGSNLDEVAFRLARDRFLVGTFDVELEGNSARKGILIPASRIDYIVDLDE